MVYELKDVSYLKNNSWILKKINLKISSGTFVSFIGPNGAGKSTLLRILSGELVNTIGSVLLNQAPLNNMSPLQLAQQRAFLSQMGSINFPYKAFEIVAMGLIKNYSHNEILSQVENKMKQTETIELAKRIYNTLSGGEMKKIDFTRTLLQDSKILLLDEPTNHLDISHQIQLLKLCRQLTENGYTIIAALHDINLAAAFSNHLVVLKYGEIIADGIPKDVLNKDLIQEVYQVACDVLTRYGKPVIIHRYY